MEGKLIIFSAPSGAGKTTIVKHLLASDLDLEFSISATSRQIRGNEIDGKDYYFHTADEFRKMIDNKEFAEWEEVYTDHYYGTLKSEIERIWKKGMHVLFDIDVAGGRNLKKLYGENALSIFIMPPSVEVLKERLQVRGTDTDDKIEMRLQKAEEEIGMADKFDVVILNDNLDIACKEAYHTVFDFVQQSS